jgi:RimJ/RimL family protein N-acetyltransferase
MRTEIETERLLLRLPRPADVETWSTAVADPEVMQYIGSGETGDRADAAQSIERFIERWNANGFGQYAVERRDDGAFLGRLGLLVWDSRVWRPSTLPEAGDAAEIELGWTLLRDYWGHGYATEASAAVRDAAWEDIEPKRLISLIHPDNVRSIRVAERLGAIPTETIQTGGHGHAVLWVHPR